jgi:hypothetical protein
MNNHINTFTSNYKHAALTYNLIPTVKFLRKKYSYKLPEYTYIRFPPF